MIADHAVIISTDPVRPASPVLPGNHSPAQASLRQVPRNARTDLFGPP